MRLLATSCWPLEKPGQEILSRAFVHLALRSDEVEIIEGFNVYFRVAGPDREALALLASRAGVAL